MFNITQIGNRVDIESSGVDFNITQIYVSGTYLPIANIEAAGYDWEVTYSGTFVANVQLIKILGTYTRNGYYYDHNDDITREITPISGTSTQIFSADNGYYADAFVANGDYIYFCYFNVDGDLHAVEYSISGDSSIDIEVDTYADIGDAYQPAYEISFMKDRKIIVVAHTDNNLVYVINFEDTSVSEESISYPPYWPVSVKTIVHNGDVWACVLCRTYGSGATDGFSVFTKNFDGISDWDEQFYNFTDWPSFTNYTTTTVLQDKYLCWVISGINPDSPFEGIAKVICFSIDGLLFQESDWVGDTDFTNRTLYVESVCRGVDGNLYFTGWCYQQITFPPYEVADEWFKYDPTINSLSLIHSQAINETSVDPPRSRVISSGNTTYIWDFDNEEFVKQTGSGGAGVAFSRGLIDNPIGTGNFSCASDNNGQRFAYAVYPSNDLHIQSMSGEGNQDFTVNNIEAVHHIGKYFVTVSYSGVTLLVNIIN